MLLSNKPLLKQYSFFEKHSKYLFKPLMKRYSLLKLEAYMGILLFFPENLSIEFLRKVVELAGIPVSITTTAQCSRCTDQQKRCQHQFYGERLRQMTLFIDRQPERKPRSINLVERLSHYVSVHC